MHFFCFKSSGIVPKPFPKASPKGEPKGSKKTLLESNLGKYELWESNLVAKNKSGFTFEIDDCRTGHS